jgi:hypothetical protein
MTDLKISQLTELSSVDDTSDVLPVVDTSATTTKKITLATILSWLSSVAQTLTNKVIDADNNTITNIDNAEIKASAAIALDKLAATTASRALVSDASGFVTAATTTATEIGYVNGVTSAIQTQINTKAPTANPSFTGTVTLPTGLTGVLRADSGVVSTDSNVTDLVSAADTTTAGKVELATDAETLAASSDSVVMTPGNFGANIRRIYKSADETVNNSDVLQNDNDLFFSIGANEVWTFYIRAIINSGTTPDLVLNFTVPSGATGGWAQLYLSGGVAERSFGGSGLAVSTSGSDQTYSPGGVVINGATPGTVQFQWCQNVATMSDTTIKAGSFLIAHRLA